MTSLSRYRTVLCSSVVHCTVLYWSALYCTVVAYIDVWYSTLCVFHPFLGILLPIPGVPHDLLVQVRREHAGVGLRTNTNLR